MICASFNDDFEKGLRKLTMSSLVLKQKIENVN